MSTPAISLLAAALAGGCAFGYQPLTPTTVGGEGREGQPAAAYEVRDDEGTLAQVSVWSQGIYPADDGSAVLVHACIGVENQGSTALWLDTTALTLEAFDTAGAPLGPPRLSSVEPPGLELRAVPPASATAFDLVFAVDRHVEPARIASLRLGWTLRHDDGRRYQQSTDFTRDLERSGPEVRAYVPIFGFYDPFWFWLPRGAGYHARVRSIFVHPHAARSH